MSDLPNHDPGPGGGHDPRAQQALDGAAVVLRPVVRWLLRHGVHYGALTQVLKQVFLAEARSELQRRGGKVTDSALSVLSGVHRKDVRALGSQALPEMPLVPHAGVRCCSHGGSPILAIAIRAARRSWRVCRAMARCPASRRWHARLQAMFIRARCSKSCSAWAWSASMVMRCASRPTDSSAAPKMPALRRTLAVNAADHLSAAVHNLQAGSGFKFLEQSVYANGLSAESGDKLAAVARSVWAPAFDGMVAAATECVRADNRRDDTPLRMRFGVYYYHEAHGPEGDGGPADAAPKAAPRGE